MRAQWRKIHPDMTQPAQLVGKRFGFLVVIARDSSNHRGACWRVLCDCGNEVRLSTDLLLRDGRKACGHGCEKTKIHGAYEDGAPTKEYSIWMGMLARCNNPKSESFKNYGGRGIKVCDRWTASFEAFLADVGKPGPGLSLDRIDNERGYEPGNVRWATMSQQLRNTRRNRIVTAFGESHCVAKWVEMRPFLTQNAVISRLNHGWAAERALSTPVAPRRKQNGR